MKVADKVCWEAVVRDESRLVGVKVAGQNFMEWHVTNVNVIPLSPTPVHKHSLFDPAYGSTSHFHMLSLPFPKLSLCHLWMSNMYATIIAKGRKVTGKSASGC